MTYSSITLPRNHALANYKMVAMDMDGTLLNQQHQLSPRTIQAVQHIANLGITVLLATGRMVAAITDHLKLLGTQGIVVAHNGALVKDVQTNHIYHHETISQQVVQMVLKQAEKNKIVTHLNLDDEVYFNQQNPLSEKFAKELRISLTYISELSGVSGNPTSILMMDRKSVLNEVLNDVQNHAPDGFDYVLIPWIDEIWQLQLLPPNTSKGKGVLEVASQLDISPESIISFGDSYNDIDMIQQTGLGIAMGNAVQKLKDVADYVTLPNHRDGVAMVLEELVKSWK